MRAIQTIPPLLLLLFAMLAPASAVAARPGVNVGVVTPSEVQRAVDTGAGEIRIFVNWIDYEPKGAGEFKDASSTPIARATFAGIRVAKAAGRQVMLVVTGAPPWANGGHGGADGTSYPPLGANVADYASFVGRLTKALAADGLSVDQVEVWNEADGGEFWLPSPDVAAYTELLKQTYRAVKDPATGDPTVQVFTGPTAGNDFAWVQGIYENGGKGSFDGVSVHTDTACLVARPDDFYREDGRLGRFTFLAYREVRATMLANGDDKPIAMSELGWTSTNGGPESCTRGTFAGKKANGVSPERQAQYLTLAFQCLAIDPYVTIANWFQLQDTATDPSDELGHYGLFDTRGTAKPALDAFKTVAAAGGGGPGECGDFDGPTVKITKPAEGDQFVDKIDLQAVASDAGVGLGRISFFIDGDKDEIRNFTGDLKNEAPVGLEPWQGSGTLSLGKHTITALALDKNGNTTKDTITVAKVAAGSLKATLVPKAKLARKVTCNKRGCSISGRLLKGVAGAPSIGGKVAVEWQFRNKKGKWRKLKGGLKPASKPFTFRFKPKFKGRWRVRIVYKGLAPYKPFRSKYILFRVR